MKKRASSGGKLEKVYKGLSLVVATFIALPTQLLFLTPVPVVHAQGAPEKVTICHATGNGFVPNQPNKTADAGGHAGEGHQEGEDIIPPFEYDGGTFPGQNWTEEGIAIYENDCVAPEENDEHEQCDEDEYWNEDEEECVPNDKDVDDECGEGYYFNEEERDCLPEDDDNEPNQCDLYNAEQLVLCLESGEPTGDCEPYDYNDTGTINITDFGYIMSLIGECNEVDYCSLYDADTLVACLGQEPTGDCEPYDYDESDTINITDYNYIWPLIEECDGSPDQCELYDAEEFQACFGQAAEGECTKYDLYQDEYNVIGGPDFSVLSQILASCEYDACPNLEGNQQEPPEGTHTDEAGNCVPNEDDEIEYGAYCGDGEVNQEWEQCDAGPASSESCTEQCQLPEQNQCSDITLAKITIDDVINEGEGDMTSNIYVGDDTGPVPSGSWFLLYFNGLFVEDVDIPAYEDVPGLAVERKEGTLRAVMHGEKEKEDIEHARGSIMFYNATVTGIASDNTYGAGPINKLEKGMDGLKEVKPGQDEVSVTDNVVDFWITTNTGDDGFFTDYEIFETCEGLPYCGDGKTNQEWEQCDGGEGCTEQCQLEEQDQCSDLTLGRVKTEWVENQGSGDMTNEVFVGQGDDSIPNGVWFPLYWLGSYFTDPDITGYEDVPGVAVERQEGTVRAVMHGSAEDESSEHIHGFFEVYNAIITDSLSDDANGDGASNKLEKPFNGEKGWAGDDEIEIVNDSRVNYWLTTTGKDDGFLVDYNVLETCDELPYCGDGYVNQEWEQCDGGEGCTEQCQLEEQNECNDLALAKITIDTVLNEGAGNMTDELFIGQNAGSIPNGVWFPLYWLGSYFTDPDITGYEDVPGLAVERQEGTLRTVMHGSAESTDREHSRGTVEFYNATALSVLSDNNTGFGQSNKLEHGFDNVAEYVPSQDEVQLSDSTTVNFWVTTNIADDGFLTSFSIDNVCREAVCGNDIVEAGEQCDDGNTDDDDGCNSQCELETVVNQCGIYDYEEFQACFGQAAEGECAKYNFVEEGANVIGGPDFGHLVQILNSCGEKNFCSNLSQEGLSSCLGQEPTGDCEPYDLNENGQINAQDVALFNQQLNEECDYCTIWNEEQLSACIGQEPTGDCEPYDYNDSGEINVTDFNYIWPLIADCDDTDGEEGGTCSDQLDNDEDGFADTLDRDCHTDGNPENELSYDPSLDEDDSNDEGSGTCDNSADDDNDQTTDRGDADCHTDGDPDDGDDTYDPDLNEDSNDDNGGGGGTVTTTSGGGGGGGGGAPAGLNIHTENTTPNSPTEVTITWFTNVAATSRVVYDTTSHNPIGGGGPNYGYATSTSEDATKVTFHSITITGLTPNTTYYFRPISSDGSDTAQGIELTISVTEDEIIILGDNTDSGNGGGVGGPEPEDTTPSENTGSTSNSSGSNTGTGSQVTEPEVLGLVAQADDEQTPEDVMEDKTPEEMTEEAIAGPSCSNLWFFPVLDFLPFPWCKWWPVVLLLIILAIYYYVTRERDDEAPAQQ